MVDVRGLWWPHQFIAVFRVPGDELPIPITGTEDELCDLLGWLAEQVKITVVRVEAVPRRTHEHFPLATLDTARMGAGVCGAVTVLKALKWTNRVGITEAIKQAWSIMAAKVQPKGEGNGRE